MVVIMVVIIFNVRKGVSIQQRSKASGGDKQNEKIKSFTQKNTNPKLQQQKYLSNISFFVAKYIQWILYLSFL